ncbi:MAG: cupin domain-containing protein [Candidatus Verstraetearchaeota archaeon]|jgi:mannose-6-phosphate isomerase-like protein (cupin superfamily)|nr:cupin domain-containing protein [Candidatus Verstraetearchaeota archaeon]
MPVISAKEIPGYIVPKPNERELKIILAPQLNNYDKATVLLSLIPPGSTTGLHKHDFSDEIMYVITGEGVAVEIVNGKSETIKIRSGDVIKTTAGTMHEIKNAGGTMLELFCVFIPPLPATGVIAEALNKAKEYLKHYKSK